MLGFAARANPRRPYLFVSRVLGRHVPVTPAMMRETYRLLCLELGADLNTLAGPVWVIGMAETATGLGGGIADTLGRLHGRADVVFQHSTRLPLAVPPLLTFREAHSHAPGHLLYPPTPALAPLFTRARTLLLVDDELSTGATLENLIKAILPLMPALTRVGVVSLVDWLPAARRAALADAIAGAAGRPLAVSWHALITGVFAFTPSVGFVPPTLPANVEPGPATAPLARDDLGRRGVLVPFGGFDVAASVPQPTPGDGLGSIGDGGAGAGVGTGVGSGTATDPLGVIGVGECALPAFLVAEALAAAGQPTTVQCTSRSPVLPGGVIAGTLPSPDPYGQGVGYYLHNPPAAAHWLVIDETGAGAPPAPSGSACRQQIAAPLAAYQAPHLASDQASGQGPGQAIPSRPEQVP